MYRRTFCRLAGPAAGVIAGLGGCIVRDVSDDDPSSGGEDASSGGNSRTPVSVPDPVDWPTFGADDGHTGFRPEANGPAVGRIAWSAIENAPTVLCPPTVVDGTVYVGSAARALHAFDAGTGEPVWEFATRDFVQTAPAVQDGRVFTADAEGVVYAVSTDGEEVWRHTTEQNLHSRALAVDGGTVYVGTAGDMPAVVSGDTDKSKAGKVVAIDADTGEAEWTFEGPEDWFSGPAVGDGRVYVGNHDGTVFALNDETGEEVWSWAPTGDEVEHPSVLRPPTFAQGNGGDSSGGGTIYVGIQGTGWLVALDPATGEPLWRRTLPASNVKCSPAVTDERVYVACSGSRASLDDGNDTPTPTETHEFGTFGYLSAFSRADGRTDWVHETDHDFRSSPAVGGDRVYVGGGEGALAVAREDGSEVWRVSFDRFVESSPAISGGRAFIGSADGHLYCIGG